MKKERLYLDQAVVTNYIYPYNNGNSGMYCFGYFAIKTSTGLIDILYCPVICSYTTPGNSGSTLYFKGVYVPILNNIPQLNWGWTNQAGAAFYGYNRFNSVDEHIIYVAQTVNITITEVTYVSKENLSSWIAENLYTFHSYPLYKDGTKINFTDGTYIVKDGALDATKARSEGYKQLLNTYGTFYKGTERELAESFAQNLSLLNGGGGN